MRARETTLKAIQLKTYKLQSWIARLFHHQGAGISVDVERANGTEPRIIEVRKMIVDRRERPEFVQALDLCFRQREQSWFLDPQSARGVDSAKPSGGKRRFGDDLVTGSPIRHLKFEESRVPGGAGAQESHVGASGNEIDKVFTSAQSDTLRKMVLGQLH